MSVKKQISEIYTKKKQISEFSLLMISQLTLLLVVRCCDAGRCAVRRGVVLRGGVLCCDVVCCVLS